jgi:type IV pilus assembly protein PilC
MTIDYSQLKQKSEKNLETNNEVKIGKIKSLINKLQEIQSIPSKEKQFFVQNLQVMVSGGLPLDRALKTLADQTTNFRFKKIIEDLRTSTIKGVSLADSLNKHKSVFGELFISMVQAGELSGRLDEVLKQVYLQLKKSNELKSNVKSAMTYPVIVVLAMVGIGIGMLVFVIPKITGIFTEAKVELPLPTRILISTSNFITGNGILVGSASIIFIVLFILFFKTDKGKYFFHGLFLKLPIFSGIIKQINLAQFTRNISSLIKTDIPIVKTFEVTAQIVGNHHYRRALIESAQKLKKGATIAEILKAYPKLFPPVIIQMVNVGEETGKVDEILDEMANFYEEEINRIMKTLPSIIEPVLMLILGVGVGLMAVAIIMPMYSITQAI